VHRLVRSVVADQLPAEQARAWKTAAALLIEAAIPADPHLPVAWPACLALLPHALAVLALTSTGTWTIATAVGQSGSYATARDLFRQIVTAREHAGDYGPEHPSTLDARHQLASYTGEAGDVAGARDQLAGLAEISARVLGPEHPSTQRTLRQLASYSAETSQDVPRRDHDDR